MIIVSRNTLFMNGFDVWKVTQTDENRLLIQKFPLRENCENFFSFLFFLFFWHEQNARNSWYTKAIKTQAYLAHRHNKSQDWEILGTTITLYDLICKPSMSRNDRSLGIKDDKEVKVDGPLNGYTLSWHDLSS